RARPAGDGAVVDPGAAQLAPERAPLRRPAGAEQEGDGRAVRRRPGEGLAAQLRRAAAPDGPGRRAQRPPRPPLRGPAAGDRAGHRVPGRRRGPDAALLVRRHRPRPRARAHRPGGGPRQQPAGAGQAPPGPDRRRGRRAEHPHRRAARLRPGRRLPPGREGAGRGALPALARGDPGRRRGRRPPGGLTAGSPEAVARQRRRPAALPVDRGYGAVVDAAPHPDLGPLARLIGTWSGEGEGHYPTIEPFRYREQVEFTHAGKPFLAYRQSTVDLGTTLPAHAEAGYLRAVGRGRVELVLAHPTG